MNEELIVILQSFRIQDFGMCHKIRCGDSDIHCVNCIIDGEINNTDFILKIPIGVNHE